MQIHAYAVLIWPHRWRKRSIGAAEVEHRRSTSTPAGRRLRLAAQHDHSTVLHTCDKPSDITIKHAIECRGWQQLIVDNALSGMVCV